MRIGAPFAAYQMLLSPFMFLKKRIRKAKYRLLDSCQCRNRQAGWEGLFQFVRPVPRHVENASFPSRRKELLSSGFK
jgi:hypothetical protein